MNSYAIRPLFAACLCLVGLLAARSGRSQIAFPPDPVPPPAARAAGGGEAIPGIGGAPGGFEPPTPTGQTGGPWINLGPAPTVNAQVAIPPSNQVCGAIQAIATHPANPDILYIASVNGGVWRTFNAAASAPSWTPLMETQPSLSMGAVEFDLADGTYQTLVAGSARISSFGAVGGARVGLFRTTDGGNSWSVLGSATFANENLLSVAARGNLLMAGSDSQWGGGNGSGLFRSTDTGASFQLVSGAGGSGLPAGPVSDLVADPGNLNLFYAAVRTAGIFRTEDAGATWVNVTANLTGITASTAKIEMAVHSSAGSNVVYVGVVASTTLTGVWRSSNQGGTWTALDVPITHNGSQGNLHFSVCADRNDPAVVYIGGDRISGSPFTGNIFRGNAALSPGSQFTSIVNANAANTAPHADSRELVADANGNLIQGDDGGLYRRTSPLSNAGAWTSVIGNLATIEAHDVAYDSVAKVAMVGTQDNGTHLQSANGSPLWLWISGGDGGDVAIDDKSTAGQSVRYGSSQNLGGFYRYTYNAANTLIGTASPALTVLGDGAAISVQFTTPVELNKVNPVRLIIGGGNSAYESLNRGDTVTALAAGFGVNGTFTGKPIAYGGWLNSVPNPDVLYYGSGASVRVRTTAGGSVTATAAAFPGGTVQDIVLDNNDWRRVFVCDSSAVYFSTNAGTNWSSLTGNLTGVGSLHTLEFFNFNGTDCVAVGTDTGVYCSFVNDPANWLKLGLGLPNVLVYDLTYSSVDNLLVAGTMGRGAFAFNVIAGLSGLSIANASVVEGHAGTTNLSFTVTLAPASTNTVMAAYTTTPGTAQAGSDYLATTGGVTFLPGETNQTILVTVFGDTLPETDETVFVNLSAPANAFLAVSSATGLLINDDTPPTMSIAGVSVTEGNSGTTDAVFAVTLSGPSGATVSANFATGDAIASAGSDYFATNGIVSFPPGTTSTSLTVRVLGDLAVEPDETFRVTLSNPLNATLLISNAVGTIINDDGLPGQLDHFSWSTIATPQSVNVPFAVTVTALDFLNAPVTNYGGPASLSAGVSGGGTVFLADFEGGLLGFTLDNTVGSGNGLWHLSTGRGANPGHSATTSLYYGTGEGAAGGGNYNTVAANEGAVLSPAINLAGVAAPVSLQFNYLLQTEGNANYDFALVEISTNNGTTFTTLANANAAGPLTNNTAGAWLHATVDLSAYAGQSIRLRFHFNTVDGVANTFEGWYVDDLTLAAAQSSPAFAPTVTGSFSNGVWIGSVTVLQPAVNVFLRARDNAGHTNSSGLFSVLVADDVSLTLTGTPNPVPAGSTLTYNLSVANSGPGSATGLLLTNVLPPSVTNPLVTLSQGTFTVTSNMVACDLGTLLAGSNATVTIAVTPLLAGSITNQATVSRTGPDGDPANNSATVVASVTVPSIIASGFTVVADLCNNNGKADAGELVVLGFTLRNSGITGTASNLVATLLPAPDVFAPSGPQSYGQLAPGVMKTNLFTFRANAVCGATINPTIQLQDGAINLGTATFPITLGSVGGNLVATFTNSTAITIPDSGTSTPYPSTITVSNVAGTLLKVTAKLKNMNHTWPDDLDILLVGPGGQKVMLMSDAGGSLDLIGVTLTFDDAAASALPDSTQMLSGTYRATDYEIGDALAAPAPAGPYVTNLFTFTNSNANGAWQLFVYDDAGGDQGNIAAGWELALTTADAASCCQSPLEFLAPAGYTNGTFQANAFVTPGQNYQIQASSNLFNWTPVTNVSSTSSPVLFVDPAASNFPARFYRGLSQ